MRHCAGEAACAPSWAAHRGGYVVLRGRPGRAAHWDDLAGGPRGRRADAAQARPPARQVGPRIVGATSWRVAGPAAPCNVGVASCRVAGSAARRIVWAVLVVAAVEGLTQRRRGRLRAKLASAPCGQRRVAWPSRPRGASCGLRRVAWPSRSRGAPCGSRRGSSPRRARPAARRLPPQPPPRSAHRGARGGGVMVQ